jgi:carboxylesterase
LSTKKTAVSEEVTILAGADEFSLGAGRVGALLVHGFTGSPQGLRGLGEYLADRGMAVAGIRLPGHGTTWQDLNRFRSDHWIGAVESGYEQLAGRSDQIFMIGLSFGAALVLDFSARHPERIAGIVTLGGFIHTRDPRRFLAPVIRTMTRSLPGVGNDIADPAGREIAYDRLPTAAAASMLSFLRRARLALPRVHQPILILHGRNDHTVHPANAELIYRSVSSTNKQLVWCERSYHVITLDHDRDDVLARSYHFIREHSGDAF